MYQFRAQCFNPVTTACIQSVLWSSRWSDDGGSDLDLEARSTVVVPVLKLHIVPLICYIDTDKCFILFLLLYCLQACSSINGDITFRLVVEAAVHYYCYLCYSAKWTVYEVTRTWQIYVAALYLFLHWKSVQTRLQTMLSWSCLNHLFTGMNREYSLINLINCMIFLYNIVVLHIFHLLY